MFATPISQFHYNKFQWRIRLWTLSITARAVPAPNIFTPQVRIFSTLNTRAMRNIFKLKHNHTYRRKRYRQHLVCHKKLTKYKS
nr:MAG TPA: hypothetical protein [Caudoviricetes sp.]